MSIYATQRSATRNQSTVDFLVQGIFTYGNRYAKGNLINNLGESLDAQDGILVVRSATVANGFNPATADNLADVIGILKLDGIVTLADAATVSANYATCGDIDASMLILPEDVTLDTMVDAKALKDVLTALGFVLNNVTEMTKFDN